MTKIEEFLKMAFKEKTYTFDRTWLRDLQKEIKEASSSSFWGPVERRNLKDTREDKAAMIRDLKKLLEKWCEAPVIIKDDPSYVNRDPRQLNDESEDELEGKSVK